MNDDNRIIREFFDSIKPWRAAYVRTLLHYVAVSAGDEHTIINARLVLDTGVQPFVERRFEAGGIVARQIQLHAEANPQNAFSLLIDGKGIPVPGGGVLKLAKKSRGDAMFVSTNTTCPPEDTGTGNPVAVLRGVGASWIDFFHFTIVERRLQAAERPYESISELSDDFGLADMRHTFERCSCIELVALPVMKAHAYFGSDSNLTLGIKMAKGLIPSEAMVGYRVERDGITVLRNSAKGFGLAWTDSPTEWQGEVTLAVPKKGAIVHCFASYAGYVQNVVHRPDESSFVNPRMAAMVLADRNQARDRYLFPESNGKGNRATDFEDSVAWLFWTLGFSTVGFHKNQQLTDSGDVIATCARGDFLMMECTTALFSEDKLSKLVARTAAFRAELEESDMGHIKVLPVMVSSVPNAQLQAVLGSARANKVFIVDRESLVALQTAQHRCPDSDTWFDNAWHSVEEMAQPPAISVQA